MEDVRRREDHWAIVDLVGNGGRVRTVPVPDCVKRRMDDWTRELGTESGSLFRSIGREGMGKRMVILFGAWRTPGEGKHLLRHRSIGTDICAKMSLMDSAITRDFCWRMPDAVADRRMCRRET